MLRFREMDEQALLDLIYLGMRNHEGHDGVPGAPDGVRCFRCDAERAVKEMLRRRGLVPWPSVVALECLHFVLTPLLVTDEDELECPTCGITSRVVEVRRVG